MTEATTTSTNTTRATAPRRRRHWPWWVLGGIAGFLLVVIGGTALWLSSEGSLRQGLSLAQRWLPADQTLVFSDVQGSIAGGGTVASLTWSKPGTAVTVEALRLDWSLGELLGRNLTVRALQIERVHVQLTPNPDEPPPEPFVMPAEVSLPINLTVPLNVARVEIESVQEDGSASTQVIEDIAALYRYDGTLHALRLDSARYGQSLAQAQFSLHARELTLRGQAGAYLRDLAPQVPFAMRMRFEADGTLAGGDEARIQLSLAALETARDGAAPEASRLLEQVADLVTTLDAEPGAAAAAADPNAQLRVLATVHPWRKQPVQQLDLRANRLDAAAFLASAPATLIDGEASVQPMADAAGTTWQLLVTLRNAMPGPIDQQRLPARAVEARARISQDLLAVESARVDFPGPAPAGSVTLSGEMPIGAFAQSRLRLQLQQVDLRPLMTSLPVTRLAGEAVVEPLAGADPAVAEGSAQLRAEIINSLPGPLDQERLPVDRLLAQLAMTPDLWRADSVQIRAGEGRLQLDGQYAPATGAITASGNLQRLPMRRIHRELATNLDTELSGTLSVAGDMQQGLAFDADIDSNVDAAAASDQRAEWEIRTVEVKGRWAPTRLTVERIHVDAFQAQIDGTGIDVTLPDFASVRANLKAVAPGLTLDANASMRQQSGGGTLAVQLASAEQTVAWLHDLPVVGESFGDLQATGAAVLQARWQGGWRQWMDGFARPARYPQLQLDASLTSDDLRLELPAADEGAASVIEVQSMDARVNGNLVAASFIVDGDLRINDTAAATDIRIRMARDPRSGATPRWQFDFEQFLAEITLPDGTAPWRVQISEGLQATVQTGASMALQTTAGVLTLAPPAGTDARGQPLQVSLEPLVWRRTAGGATRVQSKGQVTGIQPGWLDVLKDEEGDGMLEAVGVRTDLLLSADWNVDLAEGLDVQANLRRDEGDMWLLGPELSADQEPLQATPSRGLAAGMRKLELQVRSASDDVGLDLIWDTANAGEITARVTTRLAREAGGWNLSAELPLAGNIEAHLRDFGVWSLIAPPGWRLQGRVDADIDLDGSFSTPLLRGPITGDGLNVRSVLDGVELHEGTLRAAFTGQQLRIEQLTFQGGTGSKAYVSGISGNRTPAPSARGSMSASGVIDWSRTAETGLNGTGISMDLQARLEAMQVLVRNDRQLTLSGDLSAGLAETGLRVRGDIQVDRATILLPEAGAPTLGDDVVVVREADALELIEAGSERLAAGELESARPMDMEIQLNLGRDLALHGMGITTRLEGELTVRSSTNPGQPYIVFGDVRTSEGRYRAWGQALDVETGQVSFNGSYMNPSLNLLAIRPEIEMRAGVRVTGTLVAPRVQLYSDPPLPQAEILSWVVLGRATAMPVAAGGEGNSMQRAALGLLAGRAVSSLSDDLGVDELGLNESALSVGKRITDELYVTYSAGLSGAASTLYIFYDITRKLTLRGETGESTAADFIYTLSFD